MPASPEAPVDLPEPGPGGLTWRVLLRHAEDRLRAYGVASPGAEARWIVEEASGAEGADLLAVLDHTVRTAGAAAVQRMLTRRRAGEPLQYVLGHWAFRSLDLAVDARVLIPRPETEVVAGVAIDAVRAAVDRSSPSGAPVVAVDLGTGSGAIGLSIAVEVPGVEVWCTDRSADALAVAGANLAGLGYAATRVRLAVGSWFAALPEALRGRVAVAVSNPPYIADGETLDDVVDRWEPATALRSGPSGLESYAELAAEAPSWLARPGVLVVEIAPHQVEAVADLFSAAGAEVGGGEDLAGRARWVAARWTT